jgi:uncharacterized protein YbaR (Trm112 family)
MWWVGFVVLIGLTFIVGALLAIVFRKPHGPDRRSGTDRRSGQDRRGDGRSRELWTEEQRAAYRVEHGLPPMPEGIASHAREDRRKGERRKKRSWWPRATVVVSAAILSVIGVVAYGESQVPSIFDESNPSFSGAGWARCDTPITWSLDTSRLTPAEAQLAATQMTTDFEKWGASSGLAFRYVGEVPVSYDDTTYTLTSPNRPSDRHIYVTFLHDADSTLLDERTVGFATPTKVFQSNKEIVEGSVVLGIEYVAKANRLHRSSLYLHELGHALGLGHGAIKDDAMYYIVDTTNELSPADIAGIKALTKVCPTQLPVG